MNDVYFAWSILGCAFIFIPPLFFCGPNPRDPSYFECLCGWLCLVVGVAVILGIVLAIGWSIQVVMS